MHIPHLSTSPRVPVDRFGQPLSPGDLVTYRPAADLVFRVSEIRPVLDPSAPPGSIQVTLTATAHMTTAHGHPINEMTRIGYADGPSGQPMIGSPYRHPGPDGRATRQLHESAQDPPVPVHGSTDVPADAPAGPMHLVPGPDTPV